MKNICIIKYQTERNREVQIRRKSQQRENILRSMQTNQCEMPQNHLKIVISLLALDIRV